MARRVRRQGVHVAVVGGLSGALLLGGPVAAVAAAPSAGARTLAAAVGNTYGGVTSQGQPVVVDMKPTRRQIVRAVVALELTCTSGTGFVVPDRYTRVPVTRSGKFRVAFGPITQRNDDGTTTDVEGRMSGALNRARTSISGSWSLSATEHDTTGAVTDTCSSGSVRWKAKQ